MNPKPQLDMKVRERITGLQGIVVARTVWLNGCVRITLQPSGLHDGKPYDTQTFDEQQIEVLEEVTQFSPNLDEASVGATALPGGPTIAPTRNRDPR